MKTNILQTIFFDDYNNWDNFLKKYNRRIRPVAKAEVKKFRYCGDYSKGYRLFVCEGCSDTRISPLMCKGKFCPTCSVGESQRWAEVVTNDLFVVKHRHVVFTIDEGLRDIFLMEAYRKQLLKGLMDEASRIVMNFYGKKNLQVGIISALHTFGSKLEYNPHVHMVVTMGGITTDGKWEDYDYIPFTMLRKYWQNAVLKLIRRVLSPRDKKKVQHKLQAAYTKNGEGFYVNAPKRSQTNIKKLLEYISRYMKRGPIALSRIIMYDGEQVMFKYKDKRTNSMETMTMQVEEFIASLIRHIPDKHFKTIRRYGIYSRRIKTVMRLILENYQKIIRKMLVNVQKALKPKNWADRITEEFGVNPLECYGCGEYFEYMGMSVQKNGCLKVQYAKNEDARKYMLEENKKIEEKEFKTKQTEEQKKAYEANRFDWERLRQVYMSELPYD